MVGKATTSITSGIRDRVASTAETVKTNATTSFEYGKRAAAENDRTKVHNLAQGGFTLLVTVIVLSIVALVGGEFLEAVPNDGPFSSVITDIENNTETGLVIFATGLLIIPAAGIIGYLYLKMGGLMGGFGR